MKLKIFAQDFRPIDDQCSCSTCARYTRAYLHSIATVETVACNLLSIHNVAYQLRLMRAVRESILEGTFPPFVRNFMSAMYPDKIYPAWAVDALRSVNIDLNQQSDHQNNGSS